MSAIKQQIKYAKKRIGTLSREIFYGERVKMDIAPKEAELNKWLDQLNKLRKIADTPITYGRIDKWKKEWNRRENASRRREANTVRKCIVDGQVVNYDFCIPHRKVSDQLESEINYLGYGKIYSINGSLQNQRYGEYHHFFSYKDAKRKHFLPKKILR